MLHEERRQPGKRRIDEERDAPLGEGADLGDGYRERVGGERDRLAVEVAARQDLVADDQRVVGDRARFGFQDARRVAQLLEARAITCGWQRRL